ncbi:MAG: Nif3-like dinuclear metal center hexameric protein [Bifidobacteriaceae bacterium]|jgi:dinuclear metal center YbgI/SA1388 family protein|nr:Nif3-like dinuclear metal center hexameric protein [Bifidobacteriaceae bacterium]
MGLSKSSEKFAKISVESVVSFLDKLYPVKNSEIWDFPGLIIGSADWEVDKILYAVDPTVEVIDEAVEKNCNFIFTHHPLFFQAQHQFSSASFRGRIANQLIDKRISLYCGHTNVDKSKDGASFSLAKELNLKNIISLNDYADNSADNYSEANAANFHAKRTSASDNYLAVSGDLKSEQTLEELLKNLSFLIPKTPSPLRCSGQKNKKIKKAVIISGSGDYILNSDEAIQTNFFGADVFISSDLRHHPVLDFRQTYPNVAVIDVPHFSGEYICLGNIKDNIEKSLGAAGILSNIITDPYNFTSLDLAK